MTLWSVIVKSIWDWHDKETKTSPVYAINRMLYGAILKKDQTPLPSYEYKYYSEKMLYQVKLNILKGF